MRDVDVTETTKVERAQRVFQELRASSGSNQEIFEAVYYDLKQLARKMCGGLGPGRSMNASRLLSDLWLKVSGKLAADFDWASGAHFFSTMALAMQQLLIDHARQSGRRVAESLDALMETGYEPSNQPFTPSKPQNRNWFEEKANQTILAEAALRWLEEKSEDKETKLQIAKRQAEIMRLRLYGGLAEDEVARILGVSSETVTKDFRKAKAKLVHFLKSIRDSGGDGQ